MMAPDSRSLDLRAPRLGLWLLLFGCLIVCAPTAYPGYWQSQEGFVPVFNAARSGTIASVATTPDLWHGIGRGAFLLAQPLMLLGATPVVAVRATFALVFLLGGLGIYVWLRPRLGDRSAGLAALLYVLMPPVLATVYVRGSVGDALIIGLLPLALAGIATYAEGRSLTAVLVTVLSVLWMWRSQAGMAALATLLLVAYAAWVERSWLAVLIAAVSGAAGLASLLPIWGIRGPSPVNFGDHFVNVTQLLSSGFQPVAASAAFTERSLSTLWQNEPYRLGFAAVAFSALAIWLWTRQVGRQRTDIIWRLLTFSWVGTLILILLTLPVAAPLWTLTGAEQLLSYPWQVLLLACPLFAVAAGGLPALNPQLQRSPLWLTLVGLVLLSSYSYLHADYTQVMPPSSPVATFGEQPDFVLLDAQVKQDAATQKATLDVTWQVLQPVPFDYNVFFQAVTEKGDDLTVVAQLDAQPGAGKKPATSWQVGQIMTDTYQLQLPNPLPAGDMHYIYGYYDWRDGKRLPVDGGIDDKLTLHGD